MMAVSKVSTLKMFNKIHKRVLYGRSEKLYDLKEARQYREFNRVFAHVSSHQYQFFEST